MHSDLLSRGLEALQPEASLRRAALLLHSMSDDDREWLLAQVGSIYRARLEPLLAELAELQFPIDPELVRHSLETTPKRPAPRSPHDLTRWSADDALRALQAEPDSFIALILEAGVKSGRPTDPARNYSWEARFIACLGPQRAASVDEARVRWRGFEGESLVRAARAAAGSRLHAADTLPTAGRLP